MKAKTLLILLCSHLSIGVLGVMIGIYILPILIAPTAPTDSEITAMSSQAQYVGQFKRDLKDSDAFHWGEGKVTVSSEIVTFSGELAPGPDYKLYLSPQFVETEAEFIQLKSKMVRVGDVKTFDNFIVPMPSDIALAEYNTAIVWCETFGEFITAATFR